MKFGAKLACVVLCTLFVGGSCGCGKAVPESPYQSVGDVLSLIHILYRYIFLFLEINPLSNGRKKSGLKPSGRNLPPLRRGLKPVAPMLLQK